LTKAKATLVPWDPPQDRTPYSGRRKLAMK